MSHPVDALNAVPPSSFVIHGEPQTGHIAPPPAVKITAPDGRVLLSITMDGAVEGAIEDAGEAALIFVSELRRLIELGVMGRWAPV